MALRTNQKFSRPITTTPPENTPPRKYSGKRCRTCPSDRNTKVEPRSNGVWRTSTRRGRRQILLGRYRGHGQCHGDEYLARPFEYNTDSGPRYCKRMSDIAWKKNPYQWHGRELSCAWVTFNTVNTERKLLLKAMEHSEMDSQKDTPHPIAQYNTISNSQYSTENNASQFYDKALTTECSNCGQLYKIDYPPYWERSCYAQQSKAWSEAGGLSQLYIWCGVTLTSRGEILAGALTSLGLLLPIILIIRL